jgi:hypothetical protein
MMNAKPQRIVVDAEKLLTIIGTVEWLVRRGEMTPDQAIAMLHTTIDSAVVKA